jgi:hypothetical protein
MTEMPKTKIEIFDEEIATLFAGSGWSRYDAQHWLEAHLAPVSWSSIEHEELRALAEKYYNAPARRP